MNKILCLMMHNGDYQIILTKVESLSTNLFLVGKSYTNNNNAITFVHAWLYKD